MTGSRAAARAVTSWAIVMVCAAAVAPYLSTIDDYFIRDDFGVVQLLAGKPAGYFPTWFYTSWMDRIWGFTPDEVRPFPAATYQFTALGGASSPVAHHLFNIALHAVNGLLVLLMALRVAGLGLRWAVLCATVFVVLPVQAESVAWVTGRVDSMPALVYLATFLLYVRWRQRGGWAVYASALAVFFVALFTKQNTITMVATLVAYDLLIAPGSLGPLWRRFIGYVPFALMTAGYLFLRLRLFGQVAREEQLDAEGLTLFARLLARHLAHVIAGAPDASRILTSAVAALVLLACLLGTRGSRAFRQVLFFGPAWWMIGVAPVLVAGYESPRHVYLASAGWAVLIGLAFQSLHGRAVLPAARRAVEALAVGVVAVYIALLSGVVTQWNRMAAVSQAAVRDLEAAAAAARPGALIIAGAPVRSWEWALPFAAQPPFSRTDVLEHVRVISPRQLHCCRAQWFDDTRQSLRDWAAGPASNDVIALRWDPASGAVVKMTAAQNAALPEIARMLADLPSADLLDRTMWRLLESSGPAMSESKQP